MYSEKYWQEVPPYSSFLWVLLLYFLAKCWLRKNFGSSFWRDSSQPNIHRATWELKTLGNREVPLTPLTLVYMWFFGFLMPFLWAFTDWLRAVWCFCLTMVPYDAKNWLRWRRMSCNFGGGPIESNKEMYWDCARNQQASVVTEGDFLDSAYHRPNSIDLLINSELVGGLHIFRIKGSLFVTISFT